VIDMMRAATLREHADVARHSTERAQAHDLPQPPPSASNGYLTRHVAHHRVRVRE
jgi:hypothetical protein